MKILVQNKEMVIETPKNLWCADCISCGLVVCSNDLNPIIGRYETMGRAKEVMNEIFSCIMNGEKTYVMPEK